MALTPIEKEKLPEDLDTLKSLIDEREAVIGEQVDVKRQAIEAADAIINTTRAELNLLRFKASVILGIPTKLEAPEGVVLTAKEVEDGGITHEDAQAIRESGTIKEEGTPAH